jgi:hypothetical protein
MNKSQRKLSEWQNNIGKILKGIGAIVGGLAVGQLFKDSIRAAMDVEGAMLQIQRIMGASAAVFENWAQTQAKAYGMAREEAYQYGAIYGNLISSFARDTQEVTRYTMELLQASAVVASRTGRTMTDVMERIRSGLLGNTEAIEDLGINVNVAMLESTKAFRQFARGRSWQQLAFQEQQQIRLLAILEQANQKYGNTLADTVQTKQLMFISTLKNIRLNFGQAFLPVYDTILPILTDLANTLEASKETLQRWGQSIATVVRVIAKGFSLITGAITENWQALKFVGTTLLTYIFITKGASAATTAWRIATLTLKGELMTQVPVLSAVSTAIGTYRLQMALAPAATNIFTAALLRLRAALYAVHTALGPIGWAFVGLSLLVAGGLHLWNKYTQSLQKTPKLSNKVKDSTEAVNKAINDQADALKAAGKAAGKNLQSFDELHVLQEDKTGGIGTDFLDAIGDALAGIDAGISMPPVDFDEFLESLEEVKPTFKGFLDFLKKEAEKVLKSEWGPLVTGLLVSPFAGAIHYISQHWGDIKEVFNKGMVNVGKLLSNEWAPLIVGLLVSPFAGAIHYIIQNWDEIKAKISAKISEIKTNLATKWSEIKTNTLTKISEIKTGISTKFNEIKNNISTKINEVKTKLSDTWNSIKISAGSAWDGIKNSIRGAINSIIGYINKFIKGFNKIKIEIPSVTLPFYGKVGGWSLKLPQIPEIPTLARGGIIDQPTLAMIGERGKEAVLPLEQNTGWMDALANNIASAVGTAVLQAMQFAGGGSSQGSERELVIEMDGIKVARVLLPKLDREAQRMGMAILKPV